MAGKLLFHLVTATSSDLLLNIFWNGQLGEWRDRASQRDRTGTSGQKIPPLVSLRAYFLFAGAAY